MGKFKLGDIVINHWAGDKNPLKVMMFVRNRGRNLVFISLEGEEVLMDKDNDRLERIGSVDLAEWRSAAEHFLSSENRRE